MRSITLMAIAVAAAAGVIAAVILLFQPLSSSVGISSPRVPTPSGPDLGNSTGPVLTRSPASPTAGYQKINVTINGYSLVADIADTTEKMYAGLSVRDSMNESEGMLFPFTAEAPQGFWMKGMKFPIDIIWLDKDRRVVHIEPNLVPCTPLSCPTYTPSQPAMYVLETVAGFSAKHYVREGTVVEFDMSKQFS